MGDSCCRQLDFGRSSMEVGALSTIEKYDGVVDGTRDVRTRENTDDMPMGLPQRHLEDLRDRPESWPS